MKKEMPTSTMKQQADTSRKDRLGDRPDDAAWVSQFLKKLGRSETWLAKESHLSQKMVNFFLRGERKLSAEASARVLDALGTGFEIKKLEDEALQKASLQTDPTDPLYTLKALAALSSVPVWVVEVGDSDGMSLHGVYSSRENAQKYVDKISEHPYWKVFQTSINEYEVDEEKL